jgi:PDZ domain-containing protein
MLRVARILVWPALLAAVLFLCPIPYLIFGPGAAVDLNQAIVVPGHTPPPGRFYLTDVDLLPGRPAYYIAAKVLPGFEIIRRRDLVPPSMSDRDLDRVLVDAMQESQTNAQIVAERAAGLKVVATSSFVIVRAVPNSPGARCFRPGDKIRRINGRAVNDQGMLAATTTAKPPGTSFTLTLVRHGRQHVVHCTTFRYRGKARFGVTGAFTTETSSLPVAVRFKLRNINGSSAGLMFALQIYRTLTGRDISGGRDIAGTGVLAADGGVSAIEGAREKVRAAIKARAVVFFVPRQNYLDVKGTKGITIVPVSSFSQALGALASAEQPVSVRR